MFKVYPDELIFGESRKIFETIPEKRVRIRDNDDVSESEDIQHAI